MRVMKKYAAMLIAMVMALAMTSTAFAAGENDGMITINEATPGESYLLYRVFEATTQGEGTEKVVAYTYTQKDETDELP